MLIVIHDGGNLGIASYMFLTREPDQREFSVRGNASFERDAHRVTPWIFGTSPGSSKAYDTPLKVVPTSRAMISAREEPPYGFRVSEVGFMPGVDNVEKVGLLINMSLLRGRICTVSG
jgi:hypothetical protein